MDGSAAFEQFRWNLLFDLVFVDYFSLWEQPWADDGQRVVQAIRELYGGGLIYLFRVPDPDQVNEAGADPTLRLSEAELDSELDRGLRTDWSRAYEPEAPDLPNIWIGPTPEGEAAANDAPEGIRTLYPG